MLQRQPVQELHGNEVAALIFIDVVNRADVRVIQRRSGARFALESLDGNAVRGGTWGKELERYNPAKLGVLGLVDLAHATAA